MGILLRVCCVSLSTFVLLSTSTFIVSGSALQVATTVTLQGVTVVTEGMVVVGDDASQTYTLSQSISDPQVFGVTAATPSLVFVTDGHQVPVVTEGIALVQVTNSNGVIHRGDVLVTASSSGTAMRAGEGDTAVFAIALESYEAKDGQTGRIQAEIGVDRARAVLALQQQKSAQAQEESASVVPTVIRGAIATVLVVGGLFFVLHSFRSSLVHGVVSIGRNPRARRSILTLSVANVIFAIMLCVVVVFIAVAILILPL